MAEELSGGLRAIRRAAPAFIAGVGTVTIEGGWDGQDPNLPARRLFLEVVNNTFPAVLQSLRDKVLPLYRPAMAHERDFRLAGSAGLYDREQQPYWRALAGGLEEWGARWSLVDEWILRAAVWTLHSWEESGAKQQSDRPTGWWFATTVYSTSSEEPFRFEHAGWQVGALSRRKASAVISAAFRNELHRYLEHLEALTTARGYREARPSRARSTRMGERGDRGRRYEWLARWQVGEESQAKLAERAGVDPRTVARALKQTAEEIRLTRRSEIGGPSRSTPQRRHKRDPRQ